MYKATEMDVKNFRVEGFDNMFRRSLRYSNVARSFAMIFNRTGTADERDENQWFAIRLDETLCGTERVGEKVNVSDCLDDAAEIARRVGYETCFRL